MFAFPKKEYNTSNENVATTLPKKNAGNVFETYVMKMKSRANILLKLSIEAQRFFCGK